MVCGSFRSVHIIHIWMRQWTSQFHNNDVIHAFSSMLLFVSYAIWTAEKITHLIRFWSLSPSLPLFVLLSIVRFQKTSVAADLLAVVWKWFSDIFIGCLVLRPRRQRYKMFSVKFIHCTVRHTNATKRVEAEDDKTTTTKKRKKCDSIYVKYTHTHTHLHLSYPKKMLEMTNIDRPPSRHFSSPKKKHKLEKRPKR